jgi:transcriptional regulator with XRE-family HTH domain
MLIDSIISNCNYFSIDDLLLSIDFFLGDILFLSMDNFEKWLADQLKQREWKPADLARESGLASAVISNILNGHRNIGKKTGKAIAHALKLPVDLVFEKAGLLPPKLELSPIKRKLLHLTDGLPDSDIELALSLLEQRQDFYKKNPQAKPTK